MEEGHAWFPDMISGDYISRFKEPTSCIELASEVASHTGIHVGLTIFGCISCLPLSRMRHFLFLGHRTRRLKIMGLDTRSLLTEVNCLMVCPGSSG